MRLLVSVREVAEAREAAAQDVDFIDLKDPAAGALGGLPPARIRQIVGALHDGGRRATVSATIGDRAAHDLPAILAAVAEVADCGVDLVKVGVPGCGGPAAEALIAALADCGRAVVPVLIADHGLDLGLVARAARGGFPALMADTEAKRGGSLLERLPSVTLAGFVARARSAGMPVGLAGALRLADLPALRLLAPDFAGFRSAVCAGERSDALSPALLRQLVNALRAPAGVAAAAPATVAGDA